MTEVKKCPMTFNNPDPEFVSSSTDCIKEKCAWWDNFNAHCAVSAIATYLRHGFKIRE